MHTREAWRTLAAAIGGALALMGFSGLLKGFNGAL